MNTISFHLNSTDSIKIDKSRYRLNLTPDLRCRRRSEPLMPFPFVRPSDLAGLRR